MGRPPKEYGTEDNRVAQVDDIRVDGDKIHTDLSITQVPHGSKLSKTELEALAFMEEEVEIVVAETSDPKDEPFARAGVNGTIMYFQRGVPKRVARKFVDALLAKKSQVTTPETFNGMGERTYAIRQHNALAYPFQVIFDPNPKGPEWLRQRMAMVV